MNYSNKNMKSNFYLLTFLLIIFFTINGYAAERKKYNLTVNGACRWVTFHRQRSLTLKIAVGSKLRCPMPSTKMRLSEYPSNSIPIRLSGIASISG